jgi:ubiquinone/menaquinone biosynthesis C-methylase UbiE
MGQLGKFDTDSEALTRRIQAHDRFGVKDLNSWMFAQLDLAEGMTILDLGCGTGKQSIPLAECIGDGGHVVCLDLSRGALDELCSSAASRGLEHRITTVMSSLDDIPVSVANRQFDRVVSSYALYYVDDERRLFEIVHSALRANGILFFCGPSSQNNAEIKRFHGSLQPDAAQPKLTEAAAFMEQIGPQLAKKLFADVRIDHFENPLRFDTAASLFDYWTSYNLFDANLATRFQTEAERWFDKHSYFESVKRVIGVRAVK